MSQTSDSVEIRAPAEQTEGTRSQVLRWLKAVGDPVELNEPLIELETDKVTVEVAAPGSGVLREILKQEREDVDPGELLGRIAANGSGSGLDAAPEHVGVPSVGAGAPPVDVVEVSPRSSNAFTATAAPTASSAPASASTPVAPKRKDDDADSGAAVHSLSPAVRRLLAEHSLDPASIRGTGQGGRITVQDALRAASGVPTAAVDSSARVGGPARRAAGAAGLSVRRVPHTAIRKRIAEHMVRSLLHTSPHVTTVFEADLSAVLRHRNRHREDFAKAGAPLTLTAYFLQAAVTAIRAVPEANSRWTDAALEIHESIHIGVATALEEDLVVPVLRGVDSLDLLETARALNELITRARERHLTPADVRGGTFTISNHGVSGSLLAAPIVIHQPQSAILGIGKLEKRVVVDDEDRFSVRPRCYVTLTIDHRVLDGQRANRFMQTFVGRLLSWGE